MRRRLAEPAEIARRGDKASFMSMAEDLRERTGGAGEDWDKAIRLGLFDTITTAGSTGDRVTDDDSFVGAPAASAGASARASARVRAT